MDTEKSFEEFLQSINIDSSAFKQNDNDKYQEWRMLYESVHPSSFVAQKKFLINPIRLKYLLKKEH